MLKVWSVNGSVLAFAWLADIEAVLKVVLLSASLVWTVLRTYQLLRELKNDDEEN